MRFLDAIIRWEATPLQLQNGGRGNHRSDEVAARARAPAASSGSRLRRDTGACRRRIRPRHSDRPISARLGGDRPVGDKRSRLPFATRGSEDATPAMPRGRGRGDRRRVERRRPQCRRRELHSRSLQYRYETGLLRHSPKCCSNASRLRRKRRVAQ